MIGFILWLIGAAAWLMVAWTVWYRRQGDGAGMDAWFGAALSLRRLRAVCWIGLISAIGVVIAAPSLRDGVASGLVGDSLFTLDVPGIIGVVAISSLLALLACAVSMEKSLRLARRTQSRSRARFGIAALDVLITALLFAVVYSLLPQVYYSFYRLIIPGLPDQWVVRSGLDLPRVWRAVAFAPDARLGALAAGLLFWTLLVMALWIHGAVHRRDMKP